MRRLIFALSGLMLVGGLALVSYGDTQGMAVCTVYVNVDPNVAVAARTATVDAGTVQTGDFSAVCEFRVDANKQQVSLYVCASELYKGDDPSNTEVAPIPLNLSAGVLIDPTNANPLAGGSKVASYVGSGDPVDGFPTQCTEVIPFESSQNNHFSQSVFVTVVWTQDGPEKPLGAYSGKVKLVAMLDAV